MEMVNRVINILKRKYIEYGAFKFGSYKGKGIIYYHGIDLCGSTTYNYRFVSIRDFENQLIQFKKFFNIISIDDFFADRVLPGKFNIAITFDDGYRNNFTYAVPLLEKYKIPASIYITGLNQTPYNILWADLLDIFSQLYPGNHFKFDGKEFTKNARGRFTDIGNYIKKDTQGNYILKGQLQEAIMSAIPDFRNRPELSDYWQLASDEDLKKISKSKYITVGSHGFWHNNLGNISLSDATLELTASRNYLENLMQYEISELAYPDGSYTMAVVESARKIGFDKQLLCNANTKEDLKSILVAERIEMGVYESPNEKIYQVLKKFHRQ